MLQFSSYVFWVTFGIRTKETQFGNIIFKIAEALERHISVSVCQISYRALMVDARLFFLSIVYVH
jgi:hypothetical protein